MTETDDSTTMADGDVAETPAVACLLDESEREQRQAAAEAEFVPRIEAVTEHEDGYAFTLTGDQETVAVVGDWLRKEAACCPFATYELTVEPDLAAVELRVSGPEGTKALYEEGVVEAFGYDSIDDLVAAG